MGHTKRNLSLLVLVGVICVYGFARGRGDSEVTANNSSATHLASVAQQGRKADVTALPLALRTTGFTPAEVTLPAGNFLISVTNLTRLPELDLKLERQNGERVHGGKAPKEKRAWRQRVQLTPGTYVLTAMDNPEWVCQITITPQ